MKLIKTALVGTMVLGATISATTKVSAIVNPKTEAKVEFEAGGVNPDTGIVKPDDKDKTPIKPLPPIGENDGNEKPSGSLAITFAPVIDFGLVKIKTGEVTYSAKPMEYVNLSNPEAPINEWMPNVLNVEDVTGTKSGWTVSIQGSDFTNGKSGEEKKELEGAYLSFKTGRKVFNSAENGASEITELSKFDSFGEIILSENDLGVYESVNLLTAKKGHGAAVTTLVFDSKYKGNFSGEGSTDYDANSRIDDVTLSIPSNAVPEVGTQYVSKLTWTLTQAPE